MACNAQSNGKTEDNPWLVDYSKNNENSQTKPVDHFAAGPDEALASRDAATVDNSDSEDEDDNTILFQDMQLFLHAIGEPHLIDNFLKNKVTLGLLLEFEENDLINCGIDLVGDRKKILFNIKQMHSEKWVPSSLQDMTAKNFLTSPGIYISINDINKHIEYIGVTLKYIRRRLQSNPEILELGKDYLGVGKIYTEIEDLTKTSKATHTQINALARQLRKYLHDPIYKPPNHIDENYVRRAKIHQKILPVTLTVIAFYTAFKLSKLFK